jgi:hypothetical protein
MTMQKLMILLTAASLVASLVPLGGCGGAARRAEVTYHDPAMDFSLIRTVAVLPFRNLTTNTNAAERVRDVFMTMLQATGAVYVVPPGEVARGWSRANMERPDTPTPEEVVRFAGIVQTDVVITGTLREYGEARSGSTSANLISLSVEMIETQTGRVVWSASSTRGGVKTADRVFGGGGRPMDIVTSDAVDDLLDKLFQ